MKICPTTYLLTLLKNGGAIELPNGGRLEGKPKTNIIQVSLGTTILVSQVLSDEGCRAAIKDIEQTKKENAGGS